jgi:type IV pilus assembly protein PilN
MRITINLATRPFVELKPLYARLRMIMVLLMLVAAALGAALYLFGKRERAASDQMDALVQQTQVFQQERAANEARMRQAQNRAVLDRAQFLNGLFARKAFSWTSVMMDLEQVLPAGVQVTNIEPSVAADGAVSIHLRVSGPRDLEVDLMRNLEHSRRFLDPHLMNETAQTQESGRAVPVAQMGMPGGVEFDILSGYNPLPVVKAAAPVQQLSAGAKAGAAMIASPRSKAAAVPNGGNVKRAPAAMTPVPGRPLPPNGQIAQPMRAPVGNGDGR